jgi:hypothetical protein
MSCDCHLFVDKLLLTEALISNAISMGVYRRSGREAVVYRVVDILLWKECVTLGTLIECV